MTWESVWNVLKWVLAALVAGFIGQFGKSFALHVLKRRRKKRAQPADRDQSADVPPEIQLEQARLKAQAKIEKKRAKAEAKRLKKLQGQNEDEAPRT